MKNQVYQGTPTSPRFVLCPTTIQAGDIVIIGTQVACALNDYQSVSGGATFYFNGSFTGTVHGSSTESPFTPAAIGPGESLYATGTTEVVGATTFITGLEITADSADHLVGVLDESYTSGVASGATDTAALIRIGGV